MARCFSVIKSPCANNVRGTIRTARNANLIRAARYRVNVTFINAQRESRELESILLFVLDSELMFAAEQIA